MKKTGISGNVIAPIKYVSASEKRAIEDVMKLKENEFGAVQNYFGENLNKKQVLKTVEITQADLSFLYQKFRQETYLEIEVNAEFFEQKFKPKSIQDSFLEKLFSVGYLMVVNTPVYRGRPNTLTITEKGRAIVRLIDARLQTLKQVKSGTDLFEDSSFSAINEVSFGKLAKKDFDFLKHFRNYNN